MSVDIHYDGDQASIREGSLPPIAERPCAWCQAPSIVERVLVKERKSEGEVVRPARLVTVCQGHSDMIDRNEEVASLWRKRRIWMQSWNHPDEEKQSRAHGQVAAIEARLLSLGERLDQPHVDEEEVADAA